jgi:hypothetical protein
MNSDSQNITLQLDAHRVPLTVPRDKEGIYRQAAQLLNQRFKFYQQRMPKASAEQLWMYVSLESAVNLSLDVRSKDLKPVEDKVRELNQLIEQQLI